MILNITLHEKLLDVTEKSNFTFESLEKKVQEISEQNPYTSSLSGFAASALMGFITAYFVSRVIKGLVLAVGGYLLSLQALSSKGFITINWEKVRAFVWDLNIQKAIKVFGLSSMGFSLGFYLGVRREINKIL